MSTGHRACQCLWGKGQVKRYVLKYLLKVATEVDERTGSGKLFQRAGVQELNYLFPALVLTLGEDKVIPLFIYITYDMLLNVRVIKCRVTSVGAALFTKFSSCFCFLSYQALAKTLKTK